MGTSSKRGPEGNQAHPQRDGSISVVRRMAPRDLPRTLDIAPANAALRHPKHHRSAMLRLTRRDKGGEVRIGQAMALELTQETHE
jgi:hypothetical protein